MAFFLCRMQSLWRFWGMSRCRHRKGNIRRCRFFLSEPFYLRPVPWRSFCCIICSWCILIFRFSGKVPADAEVCAGKGLCSWMEPSSKYNGRTPCVRKSKAGRTEKILQSSKEWTFSGCWRKLRFLYTWADQFFLCRHFWCIGRLLFQARWARLHILWVWVCRVWAVCCWRSLQFLQILLQDMPNRRRVFRKKWKKAAGMKTWWSFRWWRLSWRLL